MIDFRHILCVADDSNSNIGHLEKLRPCDEELLVYHLTYHNADILLGGLEKFSVARHNINFYNSVGVTAAYSSSSTTQPVQSLVFAALRVLIKEHSILSAIPLDEHKSTPYFARLSSIDLRTCTLFVERKKAFFPTEAGEVDEEIDALLESQHKLHWKHDVGTKPFWRIVVLRSPGVDNQFMVSWVFHHALSDGTSGLVFHRGLLAALNSFKGKETLEDGPIVGTPKTDLVPPLDKIHKLPLTLPFVLKSLWRDWFPKRHPKLWTGAKITNDPKFKTLKFRTIVLSKEDTAKLLQLSRDNKTTLSGALECIASSAVLANLDPSKHDRVTVDGAISFRRFLNLPDKNIEDQIGVYVSVYLNEHVRPISMSSGSTKEGKTAGQTTALDIFSWAEARAVRSVITREIAKNGKNSIVGLLRWVGNLNSFWLSKVGKHREETFEITNIGVWKPKPEEENGDWKVGRVVFSQCSAVSGPAFAFSISTGRDGCLVLAFSWLEGVVEGPFMEKTIESTRECVAGLASGKKKQ